jgi:hypothetical protein
MDSRSVVLVAVCGYCASTQNLIFLVTLLYLCLSCEVVKITTQTVHDVRLSRFVESVEF